MTGISKPDAALCWYERPREKPFFSMRAPKAMPEAKPARPPRAFRSPPARRSTIRNGQPRNANAPIITNAEIKKRGRGEEPPDGLHSRRARESKNAPRIKPKISGRMYRTFAALCNPRAPAVSRRKQATHTPILAGFPKTVSSTASSPTTPPVTTSSAIHFLFAIFFSFFIIKT